MNKKFFSIITVVLNAKNDLQVTIDSLKKQTFKNFEYIVIDGGSTDGSLNIIKNNLDIIHKWQSQEDTGIYDAMNKGIDLCDGQYIGILNAGDTYTKEGLEIIYNYLIRNPKLNFIFGTVMKKIIKHGYQKYRIFWNFDFSTSHSSGFFIEKNSQKKLGKYNLKYKISSDYDLFYRMIVKEKMTGLATKKNEIVGVFKSGTSYSSTFSFLEHLIEETIIRIDNKQNLVIVFFIFFNHYIKNIRKIDLPNKLKNSILIFFNIIKKTTNINS
jgi:glycosyltransferase involved in cell wall biosynthesis